MKSHTLSCILKCISTWERKERDLSPFFLHILHVCPRRKIRIIPTFTVSVLFLPIIYLPDFPCLVSVLQLIFTSIIPKTFNNVHERTAIARAVIQRECEINSEWKLMKHFINFSTKEIFSAQTPRHEIQVWHCCSWIKFFRRLAWKEGFDLYSQTDCKSVVNWASASNESALFPHECSTNLIQSNNFQKCKGPRFPRKFSVFFQIIDMKNIKFLEKSAQKLMWIFFS